MDPDVNGNLGSHPGAIEWRIPRSNEMIGIDRADELGCLCVPFCNSVCVAAIRRGKSRVATSVIGQFPGNDARLIGVSRNYKPYVFIEFLSDLLIGVKFVMCLLYTKLLNIGIHTAYAISS
jgi:hypothetical protein